MFNYPPPSILLLVIGSAVLYACSCKKPDEGPQSVQPVDSTKATVLSKNSLDSVRGTYFGHTVTRMIKYNSTSYTMEYFYDGPDTVRLVVESPSSRVISVQSPRLRGEKMFAFDTSGRLSTDNGRSILEIWPYGDSIVYDYGYVVETGPYSGIWESSSFRGRK